MFVNAGTSVTLIVFFVGMVAIHGRLSVLIGADASRRGVSGGLVGVLTFLLAPVGLALWAWTRQRPPTADTPDQTLEIGLMLAALTFLTATGIGFGLAGKTL
jgi:hypothetical protein